MRASLRWKSGAGMVTAAPPAVTETLFGASFPAAGGGGSQDLTGTTESTLYVMATAIQFLANGTITGVRYYVPTSAQPSNGNFAVGVYRADPSGGISSGPVLLVQESKTAPTAGAAGTWVTFPLTTPQAVTTGQICYAMVRTNRYAFSTNVFVSAVTNGNLQGVATTGAGTAFPNGSFNAATPNTDPFDPPSAGGANGACYGIDVTFVAGP
jgi:hypothetical protein